MIKNIYLLFLLIPFLSFAQNQTTRNGKVVDEILNAKTTGLEFQTTSIFQQLNTQEEVQLRSRNATVKDAAFFNFEKPTSFNTETRNSQYLSIDLPASDQRSTLTIDLVKVDIYTDDFVINVPYTPGMHYRGMVRGRNTSLVSLSIFEDEVIGFVSMEGEILTLGKVKGEERTHVLYNEFRQGWDFEQACNTSDENITFRPDEIRHAAASRTAGDCIRQKFEIDESLTNQLGGVAQATNYGTGIFNNQKTLYANDGANVVLSELKIWSNADPAPYVIDQYNTLDSYQALTGAYNGDVAYLGIYQNGWAGGVAAAIGGICPNDVDDSKAIGGHLGNYSNVPTYSYDVLIICHEVGHLFGARHTHACVWNGNNTAIDGCAGFTEGGCSLPPALNVGTIMSYCDPVDFVEGFHPQVAQAIQNYIASRNCTSPCGGTPSCNDGIQNGDETGVDCGGPDCDPCNPIPNCTDGIQNGDETGVDCGGASCPPCSNDPCLTNTISLSLLFDNYAVETSWEIKDVGGNIVASSNGNYSQSDNGTSLQILNCLNDGCYTFTIYDSYGDGICCAYGNGSYSLTNETGQTLAAGGDFDFSESTDFCVGQAPAPDYCDATGEDTSYEWIERIVFGMIDNTSGDNGGYADFTNQLAEFEPGASASIVLYPGFNGASYREYWRIWIDYNQDGDFEDAGELIGQGNGNGMLSGSLSLSPTALAGPTRLRIAMQYNSYPEACGSFNYGEVEDYTIVFGSSGNTAYDPSKTNPTKLSGEVVQNALNLYPNPTQDFANIDYLARQDETIQLEVIDFSGKLVLVQEVEIRKGKNTFQINTTQLVAGVYLVRLKSSEYQAAKKLTITN